MLEAKDQGHKLKCSPIKKGLHKNYVSGDLQKIKKRSSQRFFRRSQKKRSSQKFFRRSPEKKNVFKKFFQALHKLLTAQKLLRSSRPRTYSRTPPVSVTLSEVQCCKWKSLLCPSNTICFSISRGMALVLWFTRSKTICFARSSGMVSWSLIRAITLRKWWPLWKIEKRTKYLQKRQWQYQLPKSVLIPYLKIKAGRKNILLQQQKPSKLWLCAS